MKYVILWNDSTEVFVLLIAPTIYFFTYALLERKPITLKKHGVHFLLPFLYLITQLGYFLNPISVKLNAYLDAYHDDIPMVTVPDGVTYGYQVIKDEFRWLMLTSFMVYLVLCAILVLKHGKLKKLPTNKIKVDKYEFTRITIYLLVLLLMLTLGVYLSYDDDGGDHFIVMFVGLIAFISSFFILSESRFFEKSWVADKYETLTTNSLHFNTIEEHLQADGLFLEKHLTLKNLAEQLGESPNLVSKVINSDTGYNFNEYINQKRVLVAKKHLLDPEYRHLTVEAIGNSVGFTSKSAFYNAFKKHVGTTPSSFIKEKSK
ncbi:helix-turn-helix domain-containing protein [Flagellimonas sp.]|uniref:helix-turn-helix domain-containing protein n=1 Tax=Flagellimonas sp. TaxID=2058762 RepID=UPI003B52D161